MGNTFHQAAITQECIGIVIDDLVVFAVKLRCQRFLSNRKTYRVSDALTQRASSGFNTRRIAIFRVTCSFRMQLTEIFDVIDRKIVTGQVEQAVNQHGAVTIRQDETVAIHPVRVGWIMYHEIIPQYFGDICHTHWRTRVARFSLLYSIHAQCTDCIRQFSTRGHSFTPGLKP